MPDILETIPALRAFVADLRRRNRRVALVPTMGALHDGHLALVQAAREHADAVIVSIFVNPTQFGPKEDFGAYPRTWDADLAKLAAAGVEGVFHPSPAVMYPPGFATTVNIGVVTAELEGAFRPGHFTGVATVVAKLLLQTLPDVALFGEKDYQQLAVIRRLTADLDIPVEIVGVPIVRDAAGLALSSRNAYLTPEQYAVAVKLNKILFDLAARAAKGGALAALAAEGYVACRNAGFDTVDYLEFRDADNLAPPGPQTKNLRLLATVRLGKTRLLDNVAVTKAGGRD